MQLLKQSVVRWRQFHGYHCPGGNTHIKNGRSLKKIFKIHTDNSYQSEFLFIQDNVYTDYRTIFNHLLHQWMKIWKSGRKLRQRHKLVRLPYLEVPAAGFESGILELPTYLTNYVTCPNKLRYRLFLYSVWF